MIGVNREKVGMEGKIADLPTAAARGGGGGKGGGHPSGGGGGGGGEKRRCRPSWRRGRAGRDISHSGHALTVRMSLSVFYRRQQRSAKENDTMSLTIAVVAVLPIC